MNHPKNSKQDRSFLLIFLFAFTLFISATLMFILQPMFGKILLPLLGGSPAVWNTCMVFYQSLLFLGYLYAHLLSTRQKSHKQILYHAGIILISLLALPLALPENIDPPTESNPTFWLLYVLFISIGIPFFVVSTTAPLMQKWFANVGHHTSSDPYYLYAASNSGSLLALLSYPFLIEPNIGLTDQKFFWSIGYAVLCLLLISCAWMLWQTRDQFFEQDKASDSENHLPVLDKLKWLTLAFVPSSLLLGLTNFISTDIASVPLLWVIPLTLYLLSFVIVFSKWGNAVHPYMVKIQPVVLLPFLAYSFINPAILPFWLDLSLHLLAFFLAVMVCHGELAKCRPHTQHLTDYYLIMSFGGMLGGMFNTFVAPFIFNAVYEYPIMIIAALMLRPELNAEKQNAGKSKWIHQLTLPGLILMSGVAIFGFVDNLPAYLDAMGGALILLAGFTYAFRDKSITLALLTGTIIFFTTGLHNLLSNTLYQDRTFFGVLSVRERFLKDEKGKPEKYHELFHGTTKHGAQRLTSNYALVPLTYYSRPGPMGQLFKVFDSVDNEWTIGTVGLGAGALVCYSKPDQSWTLYEIDPLVVEVAENPKFFTYLQKCGKKLTIEIGDARLSLQDEPNDKFDLLMLDAFSSDAVPTHLLTQEAIQLYFDKLKPDGILAFHITNRHLALKKVLADHAERLNYAALIEEFKPNQEIPLVIATDWVVMAKEDRTLQPLLSSRYGNWQKMPLVFDIKPWTDDFTNIVSIWK